MPATPYVIEDYVRWSDVDFAGIIFYGSYVRFFEIAETELFRACGLAYAQVFDRYDIFLPRKAVHSEFYSPARLDDRLRVATYVGRIGTTSLTLNFDVFRGPGRSLTAAGWMVLVCVNRTHLKPQPLPARLVEALAPHTLPLEAARAQLGAPRRPPEHTRAGAARARRRSGVRQPRAAGGPAARPHHPAAARHAALRHAGDRGALRAHRPARPVAARQRAGQRRAHPPALE